MTSEKPSVSSRPAIRGRFTGRGRVVVGIDGSDASAAALQWAADEARLRGFDLDVVLAYEESVPTLSYGLSVSDTTPSRRAIARRAERAVRHAASTVAGGGLQITPLAVPGRPGPVLTSVATGAQLLVVAGSSHRALSQLILGSTVAHCTHHAPCPVAVVPYGAVHVPAARAASIQLDDAQPSSV